MQTGWRSLGQRRKCAGEACLFIELHFGGQMRATDPIESKGVKSAKANANVYNLRLKRDENSRLRRIRDLEHENTLLVRMMSKTQIEIVRLRELLSLD